MQKEAFLKKHLQPNISVYYFALELNENQIYISRVLHEILQAKQMPIFSTGHSIEPRNEFLELMQKRIVIQIKVFFSSSYSFSQLFKHHKIISEKIVRIRKRMLTHIPYLGFITQ